MAAQRIEAPEGDMPGGWQAPEGRWRVREHLRRHTHHLHVRLNQHPLLQGLTQAGYSVASYLAVLQAYHRFYRLFDDAIAASLARLDLPFHYGQRRRVPWLEADLKHFGIDADQADVVPVPEVRLPRIDTRGALVGALYPVEGSSLGGRFVVRQLARSLGIDAEHGGLFFHGYGTQTDLRWREFCDFAEAITDDSEALREAENVAAVIFETIESLLDAYHVSNAQ